MSYLKNKIILTTVISILSFSAQSHTNNVIPPNPGALGKVGIIGYDSDNDGIRDDVEVSTSKRYPNSPKMQRVLNLASVAFTDMLLAGEKKDYDMAYNALQISSIALQCIHSESNRANSDIDFLRILNTNTNQRHAAYTDYVKTLAGSTIKVDTDPQACESLEYWFIGKTTR